MLQSENIVFVGSVLPHPTTRSAGTAYQNSINIALKSHNITYITPDLAQNRDASTQYDAPDIVLVSSNPNWVERRCEYLMRLFPVRPSYGFIRGIKNNHAARKALREATVVDLQLERMGAGLTRIKKWAPHAKFVVNMHDVDSQNYHRRFVQSRNLIKGIRWYSSFLHARWVEKNLSRSKATLIVLSAKDRQLLPANSETEILHPLSELMHSPELTRGVRAPVNNTILFVGPLFREENLDAMLWFSRDILPIISKIVPSAELKIVGTAREEQTSLFPHNKHIVFAGYVDDLVQEYSYASVVIVPLRIGAGVKFKVLDALAMGTPLVTTSVGAEGIEDDNFSLDTYDTAEAFAKAVIRCFQLPAVVRHEAETASEWLANTRGLDRFNSRVLEIYSSSK